jgi:hypothetical protein
MSISQLKKIQKKKKIINEKKKKNTYQKISDD